MAYTITNVYALDPTYTGASLRAQLYNSSNAAVGSAISTGFYERAGAQGVFAHAMSVPDDHVGWCDVYDNAAPSVILVSFPINPRELEYADARSSSILSGVNGLIATIGAAGAGLTALPGMVWSNSVRTLSSFGALVTDIWSYIYRTLTSGVTQIGSAPDPVLTLADAVAGATRPSQLITWMRDATTPEPLTGATLTGRIRNEQTLQIRNITGTLSVTDGPSGTFTWAYSAADVELPGNYSVQFTATFGSSPTTARTVAGEWLVHQAY